MAKTTLAAPDALTVDRAVRNLKDSFASQGFPVPGTDFWKAFRAAVAEALARNDESEAVVRKTIEKWVASRLFPDPTFEMSNLLIREDVGIACEILYHRETRHTSTVSEPWAKQTAQGEHGELEGLWDSTVDPFVARERAWSRRGSGAKQPCALCDRTGKIECGECTGDGEVTEKCGKCGGKGEIERQDRVVGGSRGGGRSSVGAAVVLRREQCVTCRGTGSVTRRCKTCRGSGKVTCAACQGARDVWTSERIHAQVTTPKGIIQLRPDIAMNPKWILQPASEAVSFEEALAVSSGADLAPALTKGRILHHRITCSVLPVSLAAFHWRGKERRIYIVDGVVRSKHTLPFLSAKRLATTAAVLAVVAVGLWLFLRSSMP